jgi:hypothetical protein
MWGRPPSAVRRAQPGSPGGAEFHERKMARTETANVRLSGHSVPAFQKKAMSFRTRAKRG